MIRQARVEDLEQIEEAYNEHFAHEQTHTAYTIFKRDIYPTRQTATDALNEGALHVYENDGQIAGSIIVNEKMPPEYARVPWNVAGRALVIHLLMVRPRMTGKGVASALVAHAFGLARERSCASVRLDTGSQNAPAVALYTKLGFRITASGSMRVGGAVPHAAHLFLERPVDTACRPSEPQKAPASAGQKEA